MDDETVEKYRRAGRIAREALELGREIAVEGASVIDIVTRLEQQIIEKGAKCAFPVNICKNNAAAHYTPEEEDPLLLARGDLVKIDLGAHIDGFIADTATTVEISTSNWTDLMKASEDALNIALEMLSPGVEVTSIGTAIEMAIKSKGFRPIANLTGHAMQKGSLHAGIAIPNVSGGEAAVLPSGTAVAVEPFATNGRGRVDGNRKGNIYQVIRERELKDQAANDLLRDIIECFDRLPFAARWCASVSERYEALIKKQWRHGNLHSYSVLSEVAGSMVSQNEHSTLILEDSSIIYTR